MLAARQTKAHIVSLTYKRYVEGSQLAHEAEDVVGLHNASAVWSLGLAGSRSSMLVGYGNREGAADSKLC